MLNVKMSAVLYRCPNTGYHVQSWSEEGDGLSNDLYVPVRCTVCLAAHLVNPKTGHVLGTDDEE